MTIWKKCIFIVVLVVFIGLSLSFTFVSIARDTFEYKEGENIAEIPGLSGWEFYGFNGNSETTELRVDYVRDENGNNPDPAKPVIAVGDFTVVSDEYVEFIYIGKDVKKVYRTNILEDAKYELPIVDGCINYSFKPFEIATFMFVK